MLPRCKGFCDSEVSIKWALPAQRPPLPQKVVQDLSRRCERCEGRGGGEGAPDGGRGGHPGGRGGKGPGGQGGEGPGGAEGAACCPPPPHLHREERMRRAQLNPRQALDIQNSVLSFKGRQYKVIWLNKVHGAHCCHLRAQLNPRQALDRLCSSTTEVWI